MMPRTPWLAVCIVSCVASGLLRQAAAGVPAFEAKVIDENIGAVCYAVTSADVNGDGKLDIVAVSENRVQWYEAPLWTKHVILEDQTEMDNVCIAAHDVDEQNEACRRMAEALVEVRRLTPSGTASSR